MNMGVQTSLRVCIFNPLGYLLRSGIPGSYSYSPFNLLRNLHTVFHSSCTISTFPPAVMRVSIALHPHQNMLFSGFSFFDSSHLVGVKWPLVGLRSLQLSNGINNLPNGMSASQGQEPLSPLFWPRQRSLGQHLALSRWTELLGERRWIGKPCKELNGQASGTDWTEG